MTKINFYINAIAKDYFSYLAKTYPVMCLSDEFYFFPRVTQAIYNLAILEDLDADKIAAGCNYIKNLKTTVQDLKTQVKDIDDRIDISLLEESMSLFLINFERLKIWQIDPVLYLKISLLGIEQVLKRFSYRNGYVVENIKSRLSGIPSLLDNGRRNLRKIPLFYQRIALNMLDALIDYFRAIPAFFEDRCPTYKIPTTSVKKILNSLMYFKQTVIKKVSTTKFIEDKTILEEILKKAFLYKRDLKEIYQIAEGEYETTGHRLRKTYMCISQKRREWREVLSICRISPKTQEELLRLYSNQVGRLRNFLKRNRIISVSSLQDVLVKPTPLFLRPIRASASYSSPVTNDSREKAYFYITPYQDKKKIKSENSSFNALHNEYIFITAHETYPGHHLLDSVRRSLKNPIRRQIESPLFYEGWASYGEHLIICFGYVKDPFGRLIGFKREMWRAIRAMIDVGTRIGKLSIKEAQKMLQELGYNKKVVESMLMHYLVLPGYQLCYTIGSYEFKLLSKKFLQNLGAKKFHNIILRSGQIPFELLREKMESKL